MAGVATCPVCYARGCNDFCEWVVFPFVRRWHFVCRHSGCGHAWTDLVSHADFKSSMVRVDPKWSDPARAHCPHCYAVSSVITSHSVTKGMLKKLYCGCQDSNCNHRWVEFWEFEYSKSQSALAVSKNEHPRLLYSRNTGAEKPKFLNKFAQKNTAQKFLL